MGCGQTTKKEHRKDDNLSLPPEKKVEECKKETAEVVEVKEETKKAEKKEIIIVEEKKEEKLIIEPPKEHAKEEKVEEPPITKAEEEPVKESAKKEDKKEEIVIPEKSPISALKELGFDITRHEFEEEISPIREVRNINYQFVTFDLKKVSSPENINEKDVTAPNTEIKQKEGIESIRKPSDQIEEKFISADGHPIEQTEKGQIEVATEVKEEPKCQQADIKATENMPDQDKVDDKLNKKPDDQIDNINKGTSDSLRKDIEARNPEVVVNNNDDQKVQA